MQLPDVNVLIYAHREDAPEHERYAAWLQALTASEEPFALSDVVVSGFLRIVTNPRIFDPPTPMETGRGSANPAWGIWQKAQLIDPLTESFGSKKSFLPNAILAGVFRLDRGTGGAGGSGTRASAHATSARQTVERKRVRTWEAIFI